MPVPKYASAITLAVALAAPALGGELEDQLTAINAEAAGQWAGTINSIDPATGAQTPMRYDFTLVVTSEDGLDFAYWGSEGLTLFDYRGDGTLNMRTWSNAGALAETMDGAIALAEASIPEAKVWTISRSVIGPDGASYDVVSTYSLSEGSLSYRNEASLAGAADAPRITLATGSWTRPQ